jgi:hypothetical protein
VPSYSTAETVLAVVACIGAVGGLAWIRSAGVSLAAPHISWLVALALVAPWALAAAPDLARALADPPPPPNTLSPGAVRAVRALPRFTVVAAEPQAALLLTALTDALVYSVPPGNTADTPANRPTERLRDNRRIFDVTTPLDVRLQMMRDRRIACLLVDRRLRESLVAQLKAALLAERFRDARFALFCRR